MRHASSRVLLTVVATTGGVCLACGDPTGPSRSEFSVDAQWLTPELGQLLDGNGRFIVPSQPISSVPIDEHGAEELALAYAHLMGTSFDQVRAGLEQQHGGRITWNTLSRCGRSTFTQPVYGPAPDNIPGDPRLLPPFFRRALAATWVIALCNASGVPQLSMGVSSEATDVSIVDGQLVFPTFSGGEFSAFGIPSTYESDGLYLSPEHAVRFAFEASGARVAAPPTAVQRGRSDGQAFYPSLAGWRITLEHPVTFTLTTGLQRESNVLWVSRTPATGAVALLPREAQPLSIPSHAVTIDSVGKHFVVDLELPVRAPVVFDTVRARPK